MQSAGAGRILAPTKKPGRPVLPGFLFLPHRSPEEIQGECLHIHFAGCFKWEPNWPEMNPPPAYPPKGK
jgi:hypothetical protein